MNPTIKTITAHRSVRKYKDQEIDPVILERILTAASRASSSGNMQAYSIIVTKDLETRKKLLEPHFNQSMVLDAPVLLTFCADFNRMRKWLEISEAPLNFDNLMSFMIASIDAILASQNAALAAESEGLGICYLGTTLASADRIAEILNCPQHVVPVVGFTLGYADEPAVTRDRLPLSGIVHQEKYQDYDGNSLTEIYRQKEFEGMKRYLANPELRARIEEVGATNLAQIYTKAKYTRASHLEYSSRLYGFLERQNFLEFG